MREVDASWTSKASDITGIAHDTTNQNPDTDLPHADKKLAGKKKLENCNQTNANTSIELRGSHLNQFNSTPTPCAKF
jgi:hypothetical protein